MGEAKRRRERAVAMVYHHTSTLRTNLIWMSGVLNVEGQSEHVVHPQLGTIHTSALARRALKDFPPVVWFTTDVGVPKCLSSMAVVLTDNKTGERTQISLVKQEAHGLALNRVALGFRIEDIPVVHWPAHSGYRTGEGQELNETARSAGDDPNDWWVSEEPVDVLKVCDFWNAMSIDEPKMTRRDSYVADIHRMVTLCRTQKGVYIAPTWMKPERAQALARRLNLNVKDLKDG
jgi:hypothetical protein